MCDMLQSTILGTGVVNSENTSDMLQSTIVRTLSHTKKKKAIVRTRVVNSMTTGDIHSLYDKNTSDMLQSTIVQTLSHPKEKKLLYEHVLLIPRPQVIYFHYKTRTQVICFNQLLYEHFLTPKKNYCTNMCC